MAPICRDWENPNAQIHPSILGTYAAALAECGEFPLAQRVLNRAKAKFHTMGMPEQVEKLDAYARGFARQIPIRMQN